MDRPPLFHHEHIAVSTKAGIAGPFPAREHHETVVLVEFRGQFVQPVPEHLLLAEGLGYIPWRVLEGVEKEENLCSCPQFTEVTFT